MCSTFLWMSFSLPESSNDFSLWRSISADLPQVFFLSPCFCFSLSDIVWRKDVLLSRFLELSNRNVVKLCVAPCCHGLIKLETRKQKVFVSFGWFWFFFAERICLLAIWNTLKRSWAWILSFSSAWQVKRKKEKNPSLNFFVVVLRMGNDEWFGKSFSLRSDRIDSSTSERKERCYICWSNKQQNRNKLLEWRQSWCLTLLDVAWLKEFVSSDTLKIPSKEIWLFPNNIFLFLCRRCRNFSSFQQMRNFCGEPRRETQSKRMSLGFINIRRRKKERSNKRFCAHNSEVRAVPRPQWLWKKIKKRMNRIKTNLKMRIQANQSSSVHLLRLSIELRQRKSRRSGFLERSIWENQTKKVLLSPYEPG